MKVSFYIASFYSEYLFINTVDLKLDFDIR